MSGFEIAGVVLGAIPLILKALDDYNRVARSIETWRHYEREISSLSRNLSNEQARLRNVCDLLLSNLVTASDYELMIKNPLGPLWKQEDVQRKIKTRLYRSYDTFQRIMEEMEAAIHYIKQKLHLDDQGKAKWIEESTIKRHFERACFVLNKSECQDAIDTIAKDITSLISMVEMDIKLEPQRKHRYRGRLFGLIRQTSSNVYYALRDSMSCKSDCRHQVHMDLTPESEKATHDLDDAEIIEKIGFQLAMAYRTGNSEVVTEKHGQRILWEEVIVRASTPQATSILDPTPTPQSPARPKRKGVNFALPRKSTDDTTRDTTRIRQPSVTQASTSTVSTLKLKDGATNLPRQLNMCEELRGSPEKSISGMISHQRAERFWMFDITPKKTTGTRHNRSVVSLKQILEGPSRATMTYVEKLHIAVMISSSFLQLHQTPWLPNVLTSQDVFFITGGSQSHPDYTQAFIKREFSKRDSEDGSMKCGPPGVDRTAIISLGILLLELSLGDTLGNLRHQYETSDTSVAARLLNEKPLDHMDGGYYRSAVRRCIGANFSQLKLDLDDENFRQVVYEKVVAPLEAGLADNSF
ncbi:hypothetical protein CSIM01_03102 [Colletotrichum simmondsii]|uniref:DUF7580 domain-containing protein n=1 Tax=Colletotrichum simmondsii TaxID=703756 RepID=A0A135SLA9_9PEZI|nr:hypothetical protein CSIM01_03102 [Colletotrichum simmondsii]